MQTELQSTTLGAMPLPSCAQTKLESFFIITDDGGKNKNVYTEDATRQHTEFRTVAHAHGVGP